MSHPHEHHHHHHDAAQMPGRSFAIGIGLNVAFAIVEVVYGLLSHSLALIADAGHNLGDVLGLALSLVALALSARKPSERRTFGFRRATILSSVANSLVLLFVTGGLTWESIQRLLAPQAAHGMTMIVVALAGAVVNGTSALLFLRNDKHDLNVRSAFLHLAADAVLALGVAAAGGLILVTGWLWLDPAVSIILAVTILITTWSLMKRSMNLVLDAVPEGIDPESVRAFLAKLPDVVEVHDLHIWAMSTTDTALMAHLVMPGSARPPTFLAEACAGLHHEFGIAHATLQIDPVEAPNPCALASEGVL